jgi:hypothetical protein
MAIIEDVQRRAFLDRAAKRLRAVDSGDSRAMVRLDSLLVEMVTRLGADDPDVLLTQIAYLERQYDPGKFEGMWYDATTIALTAEQVLGPDHLATARVKLMASVQQMLEDPTNIDGETVANFCDAVSAWARCERLPDAELISKMGVDVLNRLASGEMVDWTAGATAFSLPQWLASWFVRLADEFRAAGLFGPFWISAVSSTNATTRDASDVETTNFGPFSTLEDAQAARWEHEAEGEYLDIRVHQAGPHSCADEAVPVIYGPVADNLDLAERGEVVLAGCFPRGTTNACAKCGAEW